jgi:thiol:disulfide interchange protein DsbC
MKFITTILLTILFCSTLFAKSQLQIIKDILPNDFKIEKVKKSKSNLYIAYLDNGDIVYVDIQNKLLFYGTLFSIKNKSIEDISLIEKSKWKIEIESKTNKDIDVKELKKISILEKINGGSKKNELIIFDSLTCPYCVKLNKFLKKNKYKINAYKIYNNSLATSSLLQKKHHIKDTQKRMQAMDDMSRKYKIVGTPNIMIIKNNKIIKIIHGANIPELKKYISK